jgi:hypothetical protein
LLRAARRVTGGPPLKQADGAARGQRGDQRIHLRDKGVRVGVIERGPQIRNTALPRS